MAGREELRAFHDQVYEGYAEAFGSRRNAMLRMKELWSYLIHLFRDPESYAKKLRKAADPAEFEALTAGSWSSRPAWSPGFCSDPPQERGRPNRMAPLYIN